MSLSPQELLCATPASFRRSSVCWLPRSPGSARSFWPRSSCSCSRAWLLDTSFSTTRLVRRTVLYLLSLVGNARKCAGGTPTVPHAYDRAGQPRGRWLVSILLGSGGLCGACFLFLVFVRPTTTRVRKRLSRLLPSRSRARGAPLQFRSESG